MPLTRQILKIDVRERKLNSRITYLLVLISSVVLASGCAHLREYPSALRGVETREEWKSKAVLYLHDFKPSHWTPRAKVSRAADGYIYYGIRCQGIIHVGDDGWLYILTHSFHQDEYAHAKGNTNSYIGDITLAVDHNGRLYENKAHPCSGILIDPTSERAFQTVDEIISTPAGVMSRATWKSIEDNKDP